jgi:uncharacterized protein with HEPN domain
MSKHYNPIIIIDLLDAADAIPDYTNGLVFEDFLADRKTRDATYRNIEVMGEAVNRLSQDFLVAHPEIPWNKIIASRNALIHGYDQIDDRIVWNIATQILPGLREQLQNIK